MKRRRMYRRLFLGIWLGPIWLGIWHGKHRTFVVDWCFDEWGFTLQVFQRISAGEQITWTLGVNELDAKMQIQWTKSLLGGGGKVLT